MATVDTKPTLKPKGISQILESKSNRLQNVPAVTLISNHSREVAYTCIHCANRDLPVRARQDKIVFDGGMDKDSLVVSSHKIERGLVRSHTLTRSSRRDADEL